MEKKISAVLVDDESNSRFVMRSLITRHFSEVELLGEAANADDAFELINEVKPQLVFLDIQMPKADGFSLLKRFDEVPFEIIFVTSYDQYAINAIKFSALDYLLKPVELPDLRDAIAKAIRQLDSKHSNSPQVVNLLNNIDHTVESNTIAVHVSDMVKILEVRSIIYVKGDGSYCTIFCDSNEKYTTSRYLKDFEDFLGEASPFVRISRGVMINARKIRQYSKGEPCIIEMIDGEEFEVARRKKPEVLAKLKTM